MRRLLPPTLAWFVAAWWAILPINFDTLYPVHLFGAIPILVSWLVLLGGTDSRWRRGIALAIMVGSGLLVRNEQLAYGVLFALAIAISEGKRFARWRREQRRRGPQQSGSFAGSAYASQMPGSSAWSLLKPYVIPLSIVCLLVAGCYVRSTVRYPAFPEVMRFRHTNNVGQILPSVISNVILMFGIRIRGVTTAN